VSGWAGYSRPNQTRGPLYPSARPKPSGLAATFHEKSGIPGMTGTSRDDGGDRGEEEPRVREPGQDGQKAME
jgi:hypothetical protein